MNAIEYKTTLKELAEANGVTDSCIRNWTDKGAFPHVISRVI